MWVKWALSVCVVILIVVALDVGLWFAFTANSVASNIADFAPSSFQAKADVKFFYSIGNDLKYSDQIDPEAPTLLRGHRGALLIWPIGLGYFEVSYCRSWLDIHGLTCTAGEKEYSGVVTDLRETLLPGDSSERSNVQRNRLPMLQFWKDEVATVDRHSRLSGNGRYWPLKFKREPGYGFF
jgi:hypothetical protein